MSDEVALYAHPMAPRPAAVVNVPNQKITFATGTNGAVALRVGAGAPRLILVKVVGAAGASCQLLVGDAAITLPGAGDPLFDAADGWSYMLLPAGATHIRIAGGATAGDLYVWDGGC